MKKIRLLPLAAFAMMATGAWAQTNVTSTYLTNADFSQTTALDNHLCGYGKDMSNNGTTYYGFQDVDGWTSVVLASDDSNASYPNSGMGGAVFAYGSEQQMKGNSKTAPATNPSGEATGNCLGFFAVWSCGGYYYQDVTLPAGNYTITFPIYNQSGTQANTSYTGFFPTEGEAKTIAINTTVGKWVNQSVAFTLDTETEGQIRIGYLSTGSGSGANPMIFFDCVKISSVTALELAQADALSTLPAAGDGFFTMSQDDIDAFTASINAASTVAAVEAIKAEIANWEAPALSGSWNILNATAELYLGYDESSNGVVLSAAPVAITFEKAATGFYIKAGDYYINMAGTNSWSMSASESASTAWTFTLSDGKYTISGPNGLIGTDNIADGSACYGNKNASNNGTWTISEAVSQDQVEIIAAKTALQAAINAVKVPTANIGDGVFQYKQADVEALATIVATAQGVLNSETSTKGDIEAQTEIIKNLSPLVLNAPSADKQYNVIVATPGHAKENNAIIIIPGSTTANNPTGYGMNGNFAPNVNLNQSVTFTKVSGNLYNISFQTAEGTTYLTYGSLNESAAGWAKWQIQATIDESKKGEFRIEGAEIEGAFVIYNTIVDEPINCQDGGNIYTDGLTAFSLADASKPTIAINTTAAGWGTVMLPFAAELPEGVKAYSVAEVTAEEGDDTPELALVAVDALEANKPYIIEGAWNATLTGDAQGTALSYEDGLLTGTYGDIAAPNASYVLQKQGNDVGFYPVDTEVATPAVGANHAYLTYVAPAGGNEIKAFILNGNTTAVNAVKVAANKGAIYNLAGQRVNGAQKGIFIVNGQKVIK